MRLRDDAFLTAEQPQQRRALSQRELDMLQGVGDPMQRQSDDFVLSFGGGASALKIGDSVEFTTPDGVKRTGSIKQPQGDDWVVQVGDGEYNVVPINQLRLTEDKSWGNRETLRAALEPTDHWVEPRDRISLGGEDFTITVDYGTMNKVPSNVAVVDYVDRKYGARVLDADASHPGKIQVVCTTAKTAADLPQVSPSEPTETDQPGLEGEEIEGTGKIGAVVTALKIIAELNPHVDVVAGTIVEDDQSVTAAFTLETSNGEHLYLHRNGNVTPVLSDDVAPATGHITLEGNRTTAVLHGLDGEVDLTSYGLKVDARVEAPYGQGNGPMPTREDEPGSYGTGNYVVKADDSPATEEDGEIREEIAGPGEVTAVDNKAKKYYTKYFGPYGRQLTKKRKPRFADYSNMVHSAFIEAQDREPTDAELIKTLAVLHSKRTALVHLHKDAQLKSQKQLVDDLVKASTQDEGFRGRLDKLVARFIAEDPSRILGKLGATVYPRMLFGALQTPLGRNLHKMWQEANAGGILDVDVGSEDMFQTPRPQTRPSPEETETQIGAPPTDTKPLPEAAAPSGETPSTEEIIEQLRAKAPQDIKDIEDAGIKLDNPVILADVYQKLMGKPMPGTESTAIRPSPSKGQPDLVSDLETPKPGTKPGALAPGAKSRMIQDVKQSMPGVAISESMPDYMIKQMHEKIMGTGSTKVMPKPKQPVPPPPPASFPSEPAQPPGRSANRQPATGDMAAMHPRIERMSAQGSYLCIKLVWDPEGTEMMSAANIRHQLISWLKGRESTKEFLNIGTLGKPRFKLFDPDIGMAEMLVRSSEGHNMPQEVLHVDGSDNDASV